MLWYGDMETRVEVPIAKLSEERLFGGWAYVAVDADGEVVPDHSGDIVDTPEAWDAFRKALVDYALSVRKGDDNHESFEVADLVELFVLDEERRHALNIPDGVLPKRAAFVSFRAADTPEGDALWDAIRKGERKMLSIVGLGEREDV